MVFLITFLKCLIQRGAKPGVSFLKLLHFDRRFFKGLTGMFYRFSRLPQLLGLFYNFGLASVTTADNFSPKCFRHSVPTVYSILWARWASNPHPLRDTILSRARKLPKLFASVASITVSRSRYTRRDKHQAIFVGRARIELAPLAGHDLKSCAATNYATYPLHPPIIHSQTNGIAKHIVALRALYVSGQFRHWPSRITLTAY